MNSVDELAWRIGRHLAQLREERGLTQTDVAQLTGLARPNVARAECGKKCPKLSTLSRFAAVFGVPLSSIVAAADEMSE